MAESPQKLIYQVALGEVPAFYETCIESVAHYATRIGARHIVQREPKLRIAPLNSHRSVNALRLGYLPIYEKENALSYLKSYKSVLILDADVWVRPDAPDIFEEQDRPFHGVVERDMPLTVQYREKVRKHSVGQFGDLGGIDWQWNHAGVHYYNMGVMLLGQSILPYLNGQTPLEFIRRKEFERFVNGEGHWRWSTDQTLLNFWLKSEDIPTDDLDWRWNGLYGANPRVREAYFIHFFLSAKLPEKGREIPKIIEGL